jgi:4-aminobutyrate aminotransferase-like enzyme
VNGQGISRDAAGCAANHIKLRPPMPFFPEHADLLVEAMDAAATAAAELGAD